MFGCPQVLRVPEGLAGCGSPWRAVASVGTDWMPLYKSLEPSMPDAWRPEASMPGCSVGWLAGWLGWLAGLVGWLGWLAWLAWLAGWLGWLLLADGR